MKERWRIETRCAIFFSLSFAHGRWYNPVIALWLSPNEKGDYLYGGDGQDAVNQVFLFALGAFCQFRSDMGAGVTESVDLTFTKITGPPSFNEQSCKPKQNETSHQIGSAVTHAGTFTLSGIEIGGGLTPFFGGGAVEVGSLGTATPVAVPMTGIGMGMMAHGGGMLINNLRGDIGKIISSFAKGRGERPILKHPADKLPTSGQRRYVPPKQKGNSQVVKSPEGAGYVDADGNVWTWAQDQHGGPHWDVQHPNGTHTNVGPNGNVIGADRFPNAPR